MRSGGWGEALGTAISHTLNDEPRRGISRHIHMILVHRGEIRVGQNDENIYPPNDAARIEIRMPNVATSYSQFLRLVQSSGHDGACAVC